ncbi:MAG TPA: hypothetical protein VK106_00435 [Balneolaceae bacterium]|nr:hypothetical protein [Balneolaceae bacterium]
MKKIIAALFITAGFCLTATLNSYGQIGQRLQYSQQFRLGERIIRVAEQGQLSDTVSVWGDVNSPGRYLIPVKTTLPQLISYAFGPNTIVSGQTQLDWSQMRVEVSISEYNPATGEKEFTHFKYNFNEPLPEGMRTFELKNNQVITVQVKRRPSFADYVKLVAPVISAVATTIIIVDRLSGR